MSTTYADWFTSLLTQLGVTPSEPDLQGLASVVHEEGPNKYNNPFNIESHGSTPWTGSGNFNSVDVQEYSSPTAGLAATTAFLKDNSGWDQLLTALRENNTAAINQAFTNIYSWAPFHPATSAQADAILGSNMSAGTINPTTTTSAGTTATDTAYSGAPAFHIPNPINGLEDLVGGGVSKAGTALMNVFGGWLLKGALIAGGLGLVIVGLYRASEPARQNIASQVEQAAPLAAMAG